MGYHNYHLTQIITQILGTGKFPLSDKFEFHDNAQNSHKYWSYSLVGFLYATERGRIGTNGSFKNHIFDSNEEARERVYKDLISKLAKGYKPVDPSSLIYKLYYSHTNDLRHISRHTYYNLDILDTL